MNTRLIFCFFLSGLAGAMAQPFRPPAVPLVTSDPYFSIWSMADRLPDEATKHWTGTVQTLTAIARIDGAAFRMMGREPRSLAPLRQTGLQVLPTRTIYDFEAGGVGITFTFLTPLLAHDLDALSRPVTYLEWTARATDGKPHAVSVYFDAGGDVVVNTPEQQVTGSRFRLAGMDVLRLGSQQQPILEKFGDNLRIDWGYLYVAPLSQADTVLGEAAAARTSFAERGALPEADDMRLPRPARRQMPVAAARFDFGQVGATPVSRRLLLAYDDLFSIEYFYRKLRPYWRRNGAEASDLLQRAAQDYASLAARCRDFDSELMADLERIGGVQYARLSALAYRQAMAAHKLAADIDGTPLFLSKENFSNGCINTVDVFYPSAPLFLLLNTALLKGSTTPILEYASMPRWRFPFAPHDLGTYPLANGQVYGGGERDETNQMPVEESANMILLVAAIAQTDGNPAYAEKYWPVLTKWAEYLKEKGLDPEDQLCTDDFAGHLAHNANLSVKAIVALGAYGRLCETTGRKQDAASYGKLAREFAAKWMQLAADGGHYRLAFDKPDTWSQKYNLVWDKLLGLGLFPPEVARQEIAYYLEKQNAYGLPLDNRQKYTKLDWILWTATLAESGKDFQALTAPVYRFAQDSGSRVPLSDWYWTHDGTQRGFQARSVVGGVFIKMLSDPATWKKWSSRGKQ